jgi:hypothetical protein
MEHPNLPIKIANKAVIKIGNKTMFVTNLWELANGSQNFTFDNRTWLARTATIVKILE